MKNPKIKKGDTIVLTVVKMVTVYPDFVNEGYTLEKVQAFCDKNNITLETIEKDTERDNYMTAEEALKYGLIDGIMDKRH